MARPRKEDVTFEDAQGTEANQHAKELSKKNSKKEKKKYESFYTQNGQKVIKFTVKPNGVYNEYVGSLAKKKEAVLLKTEIEVWKKNGLWVQPHHVESFCAEKMETLV